MPSTRVLTSIAVMAAAVAVAGSLRADGSIFKRMGWEYTGEPLEMTGQRGVVWIHEDGTVDLHVQSSYAGAADEFAWVIPVPALPTVSEGSGDFLDDLDRATAPRFTYERCYYPCPDYSGGDADADADSPGVPPGDPVVVWDEGQVGILDYSIVSATHPEDLLAWLTDNGFAGIEGMDPVIAEYVRDGFYFFAARIRPGEDTASGISPVVFTLPEGTEPMFPMRITSLMPVESVPVTLWVIARDVHAPRNYSYRVVESSRLSIEAYLAQVEEISALEGGRTFVPQFARGFGWEEGYYYQDASDEMQAVANQGWTVSRHHANLVPARMTEDVLFEPAPELRVNDRFVVPCDEVVREVCGEDGEVLFTSGGGACSIGPESTGPAWLSVVLMVGALVVHRLVLARRRAPRPPGRRGGTAPPP